MVDLNCPTFRAYLKKKRSKLSFALKELQKDYPDYEEVKNALSFLTENDNLTFNDLPLLLLENMG